jgi:H+/Cl- antiporter ClcA
MANSDSKRQLSRTDIEIITNIFYVLIGACFALGVNYIIQFLNIVYPPKNWTAYVLVLGIGLIAFACLVIWILVKFRENHPLPPEQPQPNPPKGNSENQGEKPPSR